MTVKKRIHGYSFFELKYLSFGLNIGRYKIPIFNKIEEKEMKIKGEDKRESKLDIII